MHQSSELWPEWMDTEGLDAAGAEHDTEKLVFGDNFLQSFGGTENLEAADLSKDIYRLNVSDTEISHKTEGLQQKVDSCHYMVHHP